VPSAPKATITGLELARVSGDLAVFLGPQAEAALLVQSASEPWEPLRAGDVVLKVDGSAPELTRLREALAAQRAVTLVVLRRGRTFTVAVGGPRQP
jgi:S1-C subfamily serine protease